MSARRSARDLRRRGLSIEEVSRGSLVIIVDENDTGSFAAIDENSAIDDGELHMLNEIQASVSLSADVMDQLLDEVETELASQYSTSPMHMPPALPQRRTTLHRNRSDSHYNASTPLVVKKYNNLQLDSLVRSKKPLLMTAIDDLPLLCEITDEHERSDILIQKLSLCEVVCNYRMVNGFLNFESAAKDISATAKEASAKLELASACSSSAVIVDVVDRSADEIEREIQCIHNKALLLKECVQHLTKTRWSSLFVLQAIFRVVQTNLFRSIPDSFILAEFRGVDKPTKYTLPSWCHLQIVYELMFQVVLNKTMDGATLTSYLNGRFLNNFVQLFHSLCAAEVEYVKISLHSMYMDFPKLRDEIRISMSQYCWSYIYASQGTAEGVNAILDIMHSILQGVDDDKLNDPQKWLFVLCHVLCPLHKGRHFHKFEANLYKCIQTFLRANTDHLVMVLNNGLLRFWPQTNPEKEKLFVKQLAARFKLVKRAAALCTEHFTDIFQSVLRRVHLNLASPHFKIVDETIELFKDKLIRQCIEYHGGESAWKAIYVCLIRVAHAHFLYLTRNNAQQIMDWLKKYRITKKYVTSFEKVEREYQARTTDTTTITTAPTTTTNMQKWQHLRHMADANRTQLAARAPKQHPEQSNHDSLDTLMSPNAMLMQQELSLVKYFRPQLQRSASDDITPDEDDIQNLFQFHPQTITQRALKPSATTPVQAPITHVADSQHKTFGVTLHAGASMFDHNRRSSQPMTEPVTPSIHIFAKRASAIENHYGYPTVHKVYERYHTQQHQHCKNPTHLVLFAKKCGLAGVTFAKASKYFKARREALKAKHKRKKKLKKKVPLVPTAIATQMTSAVSADDAGQTTHSNVYALRKMPSKSPKTKQNRSENDLDLSHVSQYRRKGKRPSAIQSPIIEQIRREKRQSEDSVASSTDSSVLSPAAKIHTMAYPSTPYPKEMNLAEIAEDAHVSPTPTSSHTTVIV